MKIEKNLKQEIKIKQSEDKMMCRNAKRFVRHVYK